MLATDEGPDHDSQAEGDPGPFTSLLPVVARKQRTRALTLLRDVGLSPGQELLLMELWGRGTQSQADLAEHLSIEPPTVTKMLARMETSGLIARERSPEDRRVVLVSLTAAGHALRGPVRAIWADLEQTAVGDLSPEEQELLVSLLQRVVIAVDRADERRPLS